MLHPKKKNTIVEEEEQKMRRWSVEMHVKSEKGSQKWTFSNVQQGRCYKLGRHSFKVKDMRRTEGKPKIEIEYSDHAKCADEGETFSLFSTGHVDVTRADATIGFRVTAGEQAPASFTPWVALIVGAAVLGAVIARRRKQRHADQN